MFNYLFYTSSHYQNLTKIILGVTANDADKKFNDKTKILTDLDLKYVWLSYGSCTLSHRGEYLAKV